MPIYEYYCKPCNTIFNFLSRRISPAKQPHCPRCGRPELSKMMSAFAVIGKAQEDEAADPLAGIDEAKIERAFAGLMREAEGIKDDDPRQFATLMRKFTATTGISLGEGMEEALTRLEAGENPEQVERELGEVLEGPDALTLEGMRHRLSAARKSQPLRDDTLYEL